MLNAPIRILIVAALCIVTPVGIVVREGMARDAGAEIMLPMAAIDPRSLLSGHYVIVDFREALDIGAQCPEGPDGPAWLAFAPNGAHHSLTAASPTRAGALTHGSVAIRGAFTCSPPSTDESNPFAGWVSLDLSINRFYATQAEAERIEGVISEQRAGAETRVYGIVSVGDDGQARLKGLLVDGQRLTLGW